MDIIPSFQVMHRIHLHWRMLVRRVAFLKTSTVDWFYSRRYQTGMDGLELLNDSEIMSAASGGGGGDLGRP